MGHKIPSLSSEEIENLQPLCNKNVQNKEKT